MLPIDTIIQFIAYGIAALFALGIESTMYANGCYGNKRAKHNRAAP